MILAVQGRAHPRGDDESDANNFDLRDIGENLTPRGFGCYGLFNKNEYQCNAHCKSNGFKGGYCNALTGWFRCDCY